MLDLILRTTVILAVAWTLVVLLARAAAATRHLVWQAAVVAVLLTPLVMPLAPRYAVPSFAASAVTRFLPAIDLAARDASPVAAAPTAARPTSTMSLDTAGGLPSGATTAAAARGLLAWVWLAGSLAVGMWCAIGWWVAASIVRRARPAPETWQRELDDLRRQWAWRSPVALRIMTGHSSPLAIAIGRATVLLPESASEWDTERRHNVLVHELAHIKRGDCRVHAFAQLACAVYWFNPLVWVARAGLRAERERACDDLVIRTGARPSAYAAQLLEFARDHARTPTSAALAMARPSDLEGRLLAVLADGRARVPARGTRWAVSVVLSSVTVAVLGANAPAVDQANAAPGAQPARAQFVPAQEEFLGDIIAAARRRSDRARTVQTSLDADARERAALELSADGHHDSIAPLTAALHDPSASVREKAALGLALMSSPDVIPALIDALRDPESQVREKAAMGLAYRRDAQSVDALLIAMDDPDAQVREKAAIGLGTSGDARAAAALTRALSDADSQVREKASAGLMLLRNSPVDSTAGDDVRRGLRGIVSSLVGLSAMVK